MVFIRYPFDCSQKYLGFSNSSDSCSNLKEYISLYLGSEDFSLYCKGKKLAQHDVISNDSTVEIVFALPGGKGGFGSMLRAIGAQIEKTTNREACRDLSGRRLRDINEEQRLKRWIAKEAEREAEKIRRRKERLERLKSKPKHHFVDFDYEKEISTLPERVDDALTEGLQKTKNPSSKREACEPTVSSKKKRLWIDEDISTDSSGSDSEHQKRDLSGNSTVPAGDTSSQGYESKLLCTPGPSTSESCSSFEAGDCISEESKNNNFQCENSSSSGPCIVDKIEEADESSSEENETNCTEYENKCMSDISNDGANERTVNRDIDSVLQNEDKTSGAENITSKVSSLLEILPPPKEQENKVDEPIDLLSYQSVSELEALGLDCLKAALLARGLKCGGNISDRAQRLWKVRGLEPHEYPANLLAKNKK